MNENEYHSENRRITVDDDVAERFQELFGEKFVDGKKLNVEETIATLSIELDGEIERALGQRHRILESRAAVEEKFAFPKWDDAFQDVVTGDTRTFREIVQGLIDNFLGRKTELAWRLNDTIPIPDDANPLNNPGLELTGPWYPLDMAIKQINADVSAMMGPDDEDAAPADYVPTKKKEDDRNESVGLFLSRVNERRLLAGEIKETTMWKKGRSKTYKIEKPREEWPTSFHRVPGMHLRTENLKINGRPAPAIIVDYVIHALNDHGSLKKTGSGLYYYQPKIQNPSEATIVARLVWGLERLMGAKEPGSIIKFKALYEEASAGRFLPVIMWIWRHWLIGTNVGRWDYTGSLIEIWKNERVLPDPQSGSLMGMSSPHMMAYQKYNALLNVMAGVDGEGKLTNGAPIGGMAAAMLYSETDPYGRARHNPVTLRAIKMDKIRERLIGLIFVPNDGSVVEQATLPDILEGRAKGNLYDSYRMSWVASPDKEYVGAGSGPLRVPIQELQAMLDAKEEWVEMEDGKPGGPTIASGLTQDERRVLIGLGLLNEKGQITPWVVTERAISDPEKFLEMSLWGRKDLWNSLYEIPEGEVTIENIQHAFYMCANYGFQVLNGNLAAAIDDYKLVPNHVVRFMNDLATYRIFVGWLWVVFNRGAKITKTGWLKKPRVTRDGVIPIENAVELREGTKITRAVFQELVELHDEWTKAFFEDYDRYAAVRLVSSILVERHKNYRLHQHQSVEKVAQLLLTIHGTEHALRDIATLLGIEHSALETDTKLVVDSVPRITSILSDVYGKAPTYVGGEISRKEAAAMIAKLLGSVKEAAFIESEIEASAPRFDRSKARIIIDVLKRQLVSPLYIQHSPRVLFVIADKDDETRERILDAIYYVDKNGNPIFRDSGEPSRKKILEAALEGVVPNYAIEAHDYVHDVVQGPHASQ